MSLAARCPHCLTVFRISGPQMAAAQGWVRCGNCQAIFDAAAHLMNEDGAPLEVPTVQPQQGEPSRQAPGQPPLPDIDLELPDLGPLPQAGLEVSAQAAAASASPPQAAAPSPRPGSSGVMGWFAVGLLSASLCALLAYGLRGHLAAAFPESRQALTQVCQALGCTLPPMSMLQAIELEGRSLRHDEATGLHTLAVRLRNSADWPVLSPGVDLSLLDERGQVLSRRMISAADFAAGASLASHAKVDWTVKLDLKGLQGPAIADFRLDLYYP